MDEKLHPYVDSEETESGELYIEAGFIKDGVKQKLHHKLCSLEESAIEEWLQRKGWIKPPLADDVFEFVSRFGVSGPDDDGLFWLWVYDWENEFNFVLQLGTHTAEIARGLANVEEDRRRTVDITSSGGRTDG